MDLKKTQFQNNNLKIEEEVLAHVLFEKLQTTRAIYFPGYFSFFCEILLDLD